MTPLFIQTTAKYAYDVFFNRLHSSKLIFNACWEDPRIDRQLLQINENSRVLVITSAGCNVLDYLLDNPAYIDAVDVNPRQNALLLLKMKLIERGNYDDLFAVFGEGCQKQFGDIYESFKMELPEYARCFWSSKLHYFNGNHFKRSFYYHGTCGHAAWLFSQGIFKLSRSIREGVLALIDARHTDEQKEIYNRLEPYLWNRFTRWFIRQPMVLSYLGVPRAQTHLINLQYEDGVSGYVRNKLRHVTTQVPIQDNYFWRVYVTGRYTPTCCPNYLKAENFDILRSRLGKIQVHNSTVSECLRQSSHSYTHFILLDHQDWLAWNQPQSLEEEWNLILRYGSPGAKVLLRSAAPRIDFLPKSIKSKIRLRAELTDPLHQTDRVGTYGSLHLAEIL